jgi:TolA-binding protein
MGTGTTRSSKKLAIFAVGSLAAAGLLVMIGLLLADDGSAELAAQRSSWEAELATITDRAEEAEAAIFEEHDRADAAEDLAREELEAELDERVAQLEEEADQQLAERLAELDEREEELDRRAEELAAQQAEMEDDLARLERVQQSEFGNGTWEVGVDIEPGRYRTDPGDRCYWARLRDRSGGGSQSIIANNNPRGEQEIVHIAASDAYFESSRCGRWTPVD